MADYVNAHIVTSAETEIWFNAHSDQGFVALNLGKRYGSEMGIHLRPAEIDRLSAVLDQAREALRPTSLPAPA
jgi:hypothetical protein